MKKMISLFPLLFFISMSRAQLPSDAFHTAIKTKAPKKRVLFQLTPTLPQLLQSLDKAMPVAEKTDVYYDIAKNYLNILKIDSALYYGKKIKEVSDSLKYEPGFGKYQLITAGAFYFRNRHEEAIANLQQAIPIFSKYKMTNYLAIAYRQLAREYGRRNDRPTARQYYHKAIELFEGNEKDLAMTYYNLGRDFFSTYEIDSSIYYITASLELSERINNPALMYNAAELLGENYLASGDLDNAGKHLKYALDIIAPYFDKVQVRENWGYYAEYFIFKGDYAKAGDALKEFDKLNAMLGDAMGKIIDLKLRGELHYGKEDYITALRYLKEAFSRRNEIPTYKFDIKNIALQLAQAELKTGNADSAVRHLQYARKIAQEIRFIKDEMKSNLLLSEAFRLQNNMDSAYYYFRFYSSLKDSVLTVQKEKTIIELSAKYDAQKREQQIRDLLNQKQLLAYQDQLKDKTIEQQRLLDSRKSQQLILLTQQAEISRLQASEKNLALENREKEIAKKQNELVLLKKDGQLQTAIAAKESKQKQLAFVIIGAIIVAGSFGMYRYRQNKKLSSQLAASLIELRQAQAQLIKTEKEKEAENLRTRISRDIHDEVGATLSGVALFSEIAKQKMIQHQEQDAQEYLEHISVNSKEMVEKMSDIIWTINPKNDSFERIVFKLQSYAMNLCSSKGIQLHFHVDEELKRLSFPMQDRKNIYLLIKEAINNAVKYSNAATIYVTMRKEGQTVKIEIKDDGKGFRVDEEFGSNGIANMEARAKELNGLFCIDSVAGRGTLVQLQFDFHPIEV